ncbi:MULTISPECIES: GNAT family N-acetyltransferase [Alistipes]|uniref:GNAT family N-acetyltransferase n=1 Tax=Alistipes TaxID=239759 RepID=UPI001B387A9E|nr:MULTISPECIES: GNAT family N-acetyltransferase [Alistipes]MBQ4902699.1 GNAT family N-acetyltransferase [Alistipes sp. Marseille-P2263]MCI2258456.1 GNAT family N-acetyltransferase [Alistipes dispar]
MRDGCDDKADDAGGVPAAVRLPVRGDLYSGGRGPASADGAPVAAAVWVRCGAGFGRVAEGVPELAAALDPACRGRGVGTRLLRAMLRLLADEGYPAVSLSVQKANPAVRLYRRLGFRVVREHPEEYVMVCVPA